MRQRASSGPSSEWGWVSPSAWGSFLAWRACSVFYFGCWSHCRGATSYPDFFTGAISSNITRCPRLTRQSFWKRSPQGMKFWSWICAPNTPFCVPTWRCPEPCEPRRHGPDDSSLANDVGRRLTADFYGKREVHFHRRIGFEQTVHPKEHAGTADVFRVSLAPLALSDRAITYRHVHRKSRGSLHFSLFFGLLLS